MRTVSNLLAASEKLDMELLARMAYVSAEEDYVRIQREQLGEGLLSTGKPISNVKTGSDEYSPSYARKKGRSKPIDLRDKGDFWNEIFLTDTDKAIVVGSTDAKAPMLQENYSDEILGLNDDSKTKFVPAAGQALFGFVEEGLNRK